MDIKTFDDYLLRLFQRFSDWTHEWFGISNFWWARICSCSSLILLFIMGLHAHLFFIVNTFLVVWLINSRLKYIKTLEEKVKKDLESRCANSEGREWQIRIMILLFFFMCIPLVSRSPLLVIYSFFFSASLYFLACTPKPPSKSKLRKMLEKISASLSTGGMEPVPT